MLAPSVPLPASIPPVSARRSAAQARMSALQIPVQPRWPSEPPMRVQPERPSVPLPSLPAPRQRAAFGHAAWAPPARRLRPASAPRCRRPSCAARADAAAACSPCRRNRQMVCGCAVWPGTPASRRRCPARRSSCSWRECSPRHRRRSVQAARYRVDLRVTERRSHAPQRRHRRRTQDCPRSRRSRHGRTTQSLPAGRQALSQNLDPAGRRRRAPRFPHGARTTSSRRAMGHGEKL